MMEENKSPNSLSKVKVLVGLGVVIALVGVFGVASMFGVLSKVEISNLMVTNQTSNSASIVWTTDKKADVGVEVSQTPDFATSVKYYDDRDVEEVGVGQYELVKGVKREIHHVTVRNLDPEKEYYFRLVNNGNKTSAEEQRIATTKTVDSLKTPDPVYGIVGKTEGSKVEEGVVLMQKVSTDSKSQTISTVLEEGTYSLDIANLMDAGLREEFTGTEYVQEINVIGLDGKILNAKVTVDKEMDQPVENITLGVDKFVEKSNDSQVQVQAESCTCNFTASGDENYCNAVGAQYCEGNKTMQKHCNATKADGVNHLYSEEVKNNPLNCGGNTQQPPVTDDQGNYPETWPCTGERGNSNQCLYYDDNPQRKSWLCTDINKIIDGIDPKYASQNCVDNDVKVKTRRQSDGKCAYDFVTCNKGTKTPSGGTGTTNQNNPLCRTDRGNLTADAQGRYTGTCWITGLNQDVCRNGDTCGTYTQGAAGACKCGNTKIMPGEVCKDATQVCPAGGNSAPGQPAQPVQPGQPANPAQPAQPADTGTGTGRPVPPIDKPVVLPDVCDYKDADRGSNTPGANGKFDGSCWIKGVKQDNCRKGDKCGNGSSTPCACGNGTINPGEICNDETVNCAPASPAKQAPGSGVVLDQEAPPQAAATNATVVTKLKLEQGIKVYGYPATPKEYTATYIGIQEVDVINRWYEYLLVNYHDIGCFYVKKEDANLSDSEFNSIRVTDEFKRCDLNVGVLKGVPYLSDVIDTGASASTSEGAEVVVGIVPGGGEVPAAEAAAAAPADSTTKSNVQVKAKTIPHTSVFEKKKGEFVEGAATISFVKEGTETIVNEGKITAWLYNKENKQAYFKVIVDVATDNFYHYIFQITDSIPAGIYQITASYEGSDNYNGLPSISLGEITVKDSSVKPIESIEQVPLNTVQSTVKVLSVLYLPDEDENGYIDNFYVDNDTTRLIEIRDSVRQNISKLQLDLEEGTKYKGYKVPGQLASLKFSVIESIEMYPNVGFKDNIVAREGPTDFRVDGNAYNSHIKSRTGKSICDYVEKEGVRHIWFWIYHSKSFAPDETRNVRNSGDFRFPKCLSSYQIFEFNSLAPGNSLHNYGHYLEYLFGEFDSDLFSQFTGVNYGSELKPYWVDSNRRCGNVHNPPNNPERDYTYNSSNIVKSDCVNWEPIFDINNVTDLSCKNWNSCSSDKGDDRNYLIWWMQNIPSYVNTLFYKGVTLRNWWDLVRDYDVALTNKSLVESGNVTISSEDPLLMQPGKYEIVGTNATTKEFTLTEPGQVVYFQDVNGDGVKQDNEPLYDGDVAALNIQFNKVSEVQSYEIKNGWNLVSFPILMRGDGTSNLNKASDLIKKLKESNIVATHVITYRSGKFVLYSSRTDDKGIEIKFGEDFSLLPGEGYFIRSYSTGSLLVDGNKIQNSQEIAVENGWNLVGFYNSNKLSYGGFDVLTQVSTSGISSDSLSKWEDGMYYSIISQNGKQYGNDFKVYPTQGYFLRVSNKGVGKFAPN